jgi:hypothetical protein
MSGRGFIARNQSLYPPRSDEVLKVYKVTRPECGKQYCIFRFWTDVEAEFDGADEGDTIQVEMVLMTKAQVDELTDFPGW